MAAQQAIREQLAAESDAGLSIHESRCLCARLTECDELLQLAFLGADRACSKTHCTPELVAIRASLEAAEAQIRQAKVLADRVLMQTPASITTSRRERTA